jgi:hypothetical protein
MKAGGRGASQPIGSHKFIYEIEGFARSRTLSFDSRGEASPFVAVAMGRDDTSGGGMGTGIDWACAGCYTAVAMAS